MCASTPVVRADVRRKDFQGPRQYPKGNTHRERVDPVASSLPLGGNGTLVKMNYNRVRRARTRSGASRVDETLPRGPVNDKNSARRQGVDVTGGI